MTARSTSARVTREAQPRAARHGLPVLLLGGMTAALTLSPHPAEPEPVDEMLDGGTPCPKERIEMPRDKMITVGRGTTKQWAEADAASETDDDRLLADGEPGFHTESGVYKIGDGVSKWADLVGFLNEPAMGAAIASGTTAVAAAVAGIEGRSTAGTRRQPPRQLTDPAISTPAYTNLIGMLPDGVGKVFTNSGFSGSQIGVSADGATFTWGENFAGGSGQATGFIVTPAGEALVLVKVTDNSGPGTLRRSTGFNPATMDATSWSTVLTAGKTALISTADGV